MLELACVTTSFRYRLTLRAYGDIGRNPLSKTMRYRLLGMGQQNGLRLNRIAPNTLPALAKQLTT